MGIPTETRLSDPSFQQDPPPLSMDFAGCLDDESFGPAVRGCRDDFDFTLKFEKIFFALIPASIFIALSLSRIVYLARKPAIVSGVLLRTAKLVSLEAPSPAS